MIIENGSVFTFLVFHHALRIRLKGDVLDADNEKQATEDISKSGDESTQTPDTPATADTELADSEETSETDAATAASTTSDTGPKSAPSKESKPEEKTGHLIGTVYGCMQP